MNDVPNWDRFMIPVLEVLRDGQTLSLRELRDTVARHVGLTSEAMAARLPSGDPMADNRISWAASYLTRVNALERPLRGRYRITTLGSEILTSHANGLTERELRAYAVDGDDWWSATPTQAKTSVQTEPTPAPDVDLDPYEQIEIGLARIESEVASDLLSRLHRNSPAFFEDAVLELLIAMGYGGTDGKATRTSLANDGGIDGVIDQDLLGLQRVYVQAKRYAPTSAVERPEVQAFVGALHGRQANQGVFITTGRFTRGAAQYAETVASRVVLIDGQRLTQLMIKFGVGVQVRRAIQIVEVDEDFFD